LKALKGDSVSIVILNWNGLEHLQTFLPSVIQHTPASLAEIVLIDNYSSDQSINWVKKGFPGINIIQNSKNHGFAGGYNEGLKQVKEGIWILLNSDVEVTPNWLPPLLAVFEDEKVAAVQPKVLAWKEKNKFEHAGASGGFMDKLGYPFCRGRIFDAVEKDELQYNEPLEIFWASGACLGIRSELFRKLNGFDESFFAHMEEIDLCWRLKNRGYKILVNPQSCVFHFGGGTLSAISPRKTFLNFRNNLYMLTKNLPMKYWLRIVPTRMVLDGVAGLVFLLQGKPKHCWAVVRAHFAFYGRIPQLFRYRESVDQNFFALHLKGVYLGSVVKEYYINKVRTFKGLNDEKWS
jgi:GT2 family glycosyltransferase